MGALPDGTYHPHTLTVEVMGQLAHLTLRACPPDGDPFTVSALGLAVPVSAEDVTIYLSNRGLRATGVTISAQPWGPPGMGLTTMVLTYSTEPTEDVTARVADRLREITTGYATQAWGESDWTSVARDVVVLVAGPQHTGG